MSNSNCFTKEEFAVIYPNWYFDEELKTFRLCHLTCKQCSGPYDNNCLSCFTNNTNIKYLYEGKCINQCPNGTYQFENSEGNFICKVCYKNCETCSKNGNSIQMNCDSCSNDKITNNNGCYTNLFHLAIY